MNKDRRFNKEDLKEINLFDLFLRGNKVNNGICPECNKLCEDSLKASLHCKSRRI